MSALHELSATALSALYRRRELSPVEVTQAVVEHARRCEPQLNALYAFDADAALGEARAAEARWRRGEPLSPLDGVPCTIKENIASRGVPVPLGSAATDLVPAAEDAPPAARLREAGCVLLAKTTMPDYGMLTSGLSSFHALARNPWDLSRNPGGSSAGAAAAAAAGYGPLHVGTDIGGSIRLPASYCGIVGLKPSHGRVPIHPPYYGRVAGPMTRSVDDAAAMMAVLSRPDGRDATSLPPQDIDWTSLECDPRDLRIGLMMDAGWGLAVDPEVAAAVGAAARAFEAAGAIVEPMPPCTTREMADGLDRFWRMRFHVEFVRMDAERRTRILPYIREWVAPAEGFSATQVFHGFSQMGAMRDATAAACQRFDFVLSPVSPVPAYAATSASPLDDPARPFEHIAFTVPFNMGEQPAISVDCGHTVGGLPIGLQFVGRRHDDLGVLQMARTWERLRPPPRPWPTLPADAR